MRVKKYNFWDRKSEEMYTDEEFDYYIKDNKVWTFDNDGACGDPECCGPTHYYMSEDKDIVILEYTGVNDKNDVEIYESDLLRHLGRIYEVRWSHGGFFVVNVKNQLDAGSFHDVDFREEKNPDGFEKVGNIYENEELL